MRHPAFSVKRTSPWLAWARGVFFGALCVAMIALVWSAYKASKEQRQIDPEYGISSFILLPKTDEALPARYFAEKLDLSLDHPTNMYLFDVQAKMHALEAEPIIRSIELKLFTPGILAIRYQARTPYLYLADYQNTAVDIEGVRIPYAPFFTPRRLPQLYCGQSDETQIWGAQIDPKYWQVVQKILELTAVIPKTFGMSLQQIDLSRMHLKDAGSREIILQVDEELFAQSSQYGRVYVQPIYLRLWPEQLESGWQRYKAFREKHEVWTKFICWEKGEKIPADNVWRLPCMLLDLRLPHLGYLKVQE